MALRLIEERFIVRLPSRIRRLGAANDNVSDVLQNWLFVGSDEGGEINATIVSVLANCSLHKLEPFAYVRDLLCLLPRWPSHRVLELAPAYWRETLEKRETQQALDAHVLRRVVLGLPGGTSHRPPELPRQPAAVCDG